MSGSKALDFDAYGLLRATHSHNPGIMVYPYKPKSAKYQFINSFP